MVSVRAARLAQRKSSIKDGCDLCVCPVFLALSPSPAPGQLLGCGAERGQKAAPPETSSVEGVGLRAQTPSPPTGPWRWEPPFPLPAQRPPPPAPAQCGAAALKSCFKEQTTPLPGHDGAWGIPQIVQPLQPDWVFRSYWHWEIAKGPVMGGTALPFAAALGPSPAFQT